MDDCLFLYKREKENICKVCSYLCKIFRKESQKTHGMVCLWGGEVTWLRSRAEREIFQPSNLLSLLNFDVCEHITYSKKVICGYLKKNNVTRPKTCKQNPKQPSVTSYLREAPWLWSPAVSSICRASAVLNTTCPRSPLSLALP